jgi:DNA-binding transcriptional MerR regulator
VPKPTSATGWWKELLNRAADGRVGRLASLCNVSPRTIHRWQTEDISRPDIERRRQLRTFAGPYLLQRSDCPRFLIEECESKEKEHMRDQTQMIDEPEIEIETEEDEIAVRPQGDDRKIFTASSDPTIKDLFDRYKEGDLTLQPDFQRQFVWDPTRSSRLIESVLLGVPLPIIYLAEEADGRESVIDGQQRLTSFFDFMDGKFKLGKLSVRETINGLKFADLSREAQNTIKRTALRTITIKRESDKDLKFEIFERLNSGSVALNDQELRNCIYRGPYIKLLKALSEDPDFRRLLNFTGPDKRMRDVEFVLRFAAFYHATYLNYSPPMRAFMNRDMERHQNISEADQDMIRQAFKKSCQLIFSLFGEHSFKRFYRGTGDDPNGRWEPKKINSSLYDVLMFGFIPYEKPQVHGKLDSIRESFINLMSNSDAFISAIELSTSSKQAVEGRFDLWRNTLRGVLGTASSEPRLFSLSLKAKLYANNPSCAICQQHISSIDDSAVDHVEQYWQGGKTIAENARLTHRYCNWSRSRIS